MSSDEQWEILDETVAFDHPYVHIDFQKVKLPDGQIIADWPIVHLRDYINVVVFNEAGQMLVIESYKHAIGAVNWQVVGGYMEPGEDGLETARRELLEETGYESDEWESLGNFIVDANRRASKAHFFVARNARRVAEPDDGDLEQLTIRWEDPAVVRAALRDGRVMGLSYAAPLALALMR